MQYVILVGLIVVLIIRFRCALWGHVFTLKGRFIYYDSSGKVSERSEESFWYCRRAGCSAVNPDTQKVIDQLK